MEYPKSHKGVYNDAPYPGPALLARANWNGLKLGFGAFQFVCVTSCVVLPEVYL